MRTNPRQHLSPIERVKIETLFENGLSCAAIAKQLKRDRSTIYRELKKGVCEVINTNLVRHLTYSAYIGQNLHDERMQKKAPPLKIGNDIKYANFLENLMLNCNYSPAAALAAATEKGFKTKLTKQTIYRYIDNHVFLKLTNKHLVSGKRRRVATKKALPSGRNLSKRNISCRPPSVQDRLEFGHWEIDTVVGKRDCGKCLLVLTERKTRKDHIIVINSKTASAVVDGLSQLREIYGRKFCSIFKSFTCDNGSEFADDKGIENNGETLLFYCDPYSSWQRGSNENANKLIRRFIKKGVKIERYNDKFVKKVEKWVNNYPRAILNWSTAEKEFKKEVFNS